VMARATKIPLRKTIATTTNLERMKMHFCKDIPLLIYFHDNFRGTGTHIVRCGTCRHVVQTPPLRIAIFIDRAWQCAEPLDSFQTWRAPLSRRKLVHEAYHDDSQLLDDQRRGERHCEIRRARHRRLIA
jgi:hypothetical protein